MGFVTARPFSEVAAAAAAARDSIHFNGKTEC